MKRRLSYFLHPTTQEGTRTFTRVFSALLFIIFLTACETEIEYDSSKDKMQLVITANIAAGQPVSCYINATTYTVGYTKKDTIYDYVDNRGDTITLPTARRHKMYLSDARVQMRINNGEWFATTYDNKTHLYTAPQTLSPGDQVEITVSHPDYGTASAQQVVPQPVTVNAIHTTDLYPEITSDGWAQFAIDLDTYTGDPDNLIGIRLLNAAFTCRTTKRVWHTEEVYNEYHNNYAPRTVYDTITITDTVPLTLIYSQGEMWDLPFNYASYKEKYYGTYAPKYMYFHASELQQPKQIYLLADQAIEDNVLSRDSLQLQHLSISIDVFSADYNLYMTSVYAGYSLGIKLPTGVSYDNEWDEDGNGWYNENYMEDILKELYYLGDQEDVQIYTNITGGLGCFATYAPTQLTIK